MFDGIFSPIVAHSFSLVIVIKLCLFQYNSIDIFLTSPRKHMLWVLIRSALAVRASNEYLQHVFVAK